MVAILDGTGPLRHACDPTGAGLLAAWRTSEDEEWMRGMLASLDADVTDRNALSARLRQVKSRAALVIALAIKVPAIP